MSLLILIISSPTWMLSSSSSSLFDAEEVVRLHGLVDQLLGSGADLPSPLVMAKDAVGVGEQAGDPSELERSSVAEHIVDFERKAGAASSAWPNLTHAHNHNLVVEGEVLRAEQTVVHTLGRATN